MCEYMCEYKCVSIYVGISVYMYVGTDVCVGLGICIWVGIDMDMSNPFVYVKYYVYTSLQGPHINPTIQPGFIDDI